MNPVFYLWIPLYPDCIISWYFGYISIHISIPIKMLAFNWGIPVIAITVIYIIYSNQEVDYGIFKDISLSVRVFSKKNPYSIYSRMIMARGQHPDTLGTLKIAGFSGSLLPKYGNFRTVTRP